MVVSVTDEEAELLLAHIRALRRQQRQEYPSRPCNPATPRGVRGAWSAGLGPSRPDAPFWVTTPRAIVPQRDCASEIWQEERVEKCVHEWPPFNASACGERPESFADNCMEHAGIRVPPPTPPCMEPSPRGLNGQGSDVHAVPDEQAYVSAVPRNPAPRRVLPGMPPRPGTSKQAGGGDTTRSLTNMVESLHKGLWQVLQIVPQPCCSEDPLSHTGSQDQGDGTLRQPRRSVGELRFHEEGSANTPPPTCRLQDQASVKVSALVTAYCGSLEQVPEQQSRGNPSPLAAPMCAALATAPGGTTTPQTKIPHGACCASAPSGCCVGEERDAGEPPARTNAAKFFDREKATTVPQVDNLGQGFELDVHRRGGA